MYALTDPLLLKWLKLQASHDVHVTLYFDPSAGHVESSPHFDAIPLKTRGLMHQKILIIDDHLVFLGSANMTTSSLVLHDNLTLGFHSPLLAQFLKDPLHYAPHLPRQKIPSYPPLPFQIGSQQAQLWMLPDRQGSALAQVIHEIDSATKTIFISMFTLTHPDLTEALISAKKRGVDVRLCSDFYAGRGASRKSLKRLQEENIPLLFSQGQQLLHHKWALIDDHTLIVGSTNWTKAAFTKNRDCLLFLKDLSSDQQAYLKRLWKVVVSDGRKNF
jgi:phosphatidylserine/phosphatidylglycerophosphate/cardiolipin synthase-like enzyme